jgi:isoquinoline 1-oxidoreductase alpha subunit
MPLLWYLRDILGLSGSKFGCGIGLCGACMVYVNGEATRSCITPVRDTATKEVITIEGLAQNGLHPVQRAWMQINVPQCGYCQVGQIMQAAAFLKKNKQDAGQIHDLVAYIRALAAKK